jgi:tRNA threonylcarbamoyladenosine biosynthesis protein TsaB
MRFIVLDTADTHGSVALFEASRLIALESHSSDEDYSSWLLSTVHRSLEKSALSLAHLDGYAVCAGPGSFTGLRVGLTTVKAWAEIYGKPIVGLSRLEALALSPTAPARPFVAVCIDARRDQVFAALYARHENRLEPTLQECVAPLDSFVAATLEQTRGNAVHWITPDPDLLKSSREWASLVAAGHVLQVVSPPFAISLGALAYDKFRQGQTDDAVTLDANYVRRSDAEIFWKGNQRALRV